jgi:hypothetical protein
VEFLGSTERPERGERGSCQQVHSQQWRIDAVGKTGCRFATARTRPDRRAIRDPRRWAVIAAAW